MRRVEAVNLQQLSLGGVWGLYCVLLPLRCREKQGGIAHSWSVRRYPNTVLNINWFNQLDDFEFQSSLLNIKVDQPTDTAYRLLCQGFCWALVARSLAVCLDCHAASVLWWWPLRWCVSNIISFPIEIDCCVFVCELMLYLCDVGASRFCSDRTELTKPAERMKCLLITSLSDWLSCSLSSACCAF